MEFGAWNLVFPPLGVYFGRTKGKSVIKLKLKGKVYRGWWIVTASVAILSIVFGVGFYSFGIFFKPLTVDFGWSRAAVSGAMSLFTLLWGLSAALGGRLSDRFGPKIIMLFSAIPFGGSFLLLSRTQTIWQLYVFYSLLAFTYGGLSLVPISNMVNKWFLSQKGLAMGITFSGVSLGGLIFAPVVGYIVDTFGWRGAYAILGIGSWIILLPAIIFVLKDKPDTVSRPEVDTKKIDISLASGKAIVSPVSPQWTVRKMVRSPVFWAISVSFFLVNLGQIGVLTHEVPFLTDMGISPVVAASILGFTSGLGILGKLIAGYAADRLSRLSITFISFILQAAGLFMLMAAGNMLLVWAFVIIFGMSIGSTAVVRPLMVSEYFGNVSFGAVYGWIELTRLLGATLGPLFAGWIYDITLSYTWAFIPFMAFFILGILPLVLIRKVKL